MLVDMKFASALLALSAGGTRGAALTTLPRQDNGTACGQLATRFPDKAFAPGTATYTHKSTDEIWASTCVLGPACVFIPSDENDVAAALGIIHDAQTIFSVASGGHMPVPGAQSNNGGVMISLANINTKEFNSDRSVASIGPGNRWIEVYNWTAPYGLAVAGGRYSNVGVGGLLVSGGINYFGNRYGFSVNTLVGARVVLGNGTIVEASKTSNPDLFWALKGGSNNYGIVTRYDMVTIPLTTAYGGLAVWQGSDATAQFIEACQSFIESPKGIDDLDTEINPSITIIPTKDNVTWQPVIAPFVSGSHSGTPSSLVNFTAIASPVLNNLAQEENWVDIPNKVQEVNTEDANGQGQIFGCLSSKIAPGLIQLAVDTVLTPAIEQLSDVKGAFIAVSPESISQTQLQAAQDSGEYAIDLDPKDGSFVILLVTVTWTDSSDDEKVKTFMSGILPKLKDALVGRELFLDFVYIGDAAPGQYPYSAYGKGLSLPRMKDIQATYDSLGIFKNFITSGFKL